MHDFALILWLLGALLTMVGLAGMVLPLLPGAPLLFLGLLLGAWADDFRYVGLWAVLLLAVLAALTYAVDVAAMLLGVKKYGGSRRAMAGAALGGVVGLFFGLPGVLIGPFAGAVLGELAQQRGLHEAGRAGFGTVVGLALGLAGKLAIGMIMIGIFVVKRFF